MIVKDLVSELRFQPPQVVANMFVIPITSSKPLGDLSGDMLLQITSDTDYSRLTLKNIDDKPVIVPTGMRFYAKKGQDRVVKKTAVIESDEEEDMDVACIEPSEGAHMRRGDSEFSFIPAKLRVPTLERRDDVSYTTIWEDIKKYLSDSGVTGDAMKNFYLTFERELEEFIAQFEPVPDQVGAVIMINNIVAGVEVYPNHLAWLRVWRHLIRDSYGADALLHIQKRNVVTYKPTVNLDNVHNFKDLRDEVAHVKLELSNFVVRAVEDVLVSDLSVSEPSAHGDYQVSNIESDKHIGQMVKSGDNLVFFSLLRR